LLGSDLSHYPYASRRAVVLGMRGVVATSHPLAAQAGVHVLGQGGNAVDAAVAAAAALTVVASTVCGIGGDLIAMVRNAGRTYVLNATGKAPAGLSADVVVRAGHKTVPRLGPLSITVPGIPRGWADLCHRFGALSLQQVLTPAIDYARGGYPVNGLSAHAWRRYHEIFRKQGDAHFDNWFRTFAAEGSTPVAGQIWRSAVHAETLAAIAETNADAFYHGALARSVAQSVQAYGGVLSVDDLAEHASAWHEAISADFRGFTISQAPPNSQGLVSLVALKMLNQLPVRDVDSVEGIHLQVEVMKQAFAAAEACIAQGDLAGAEALLSDSSIERLLETIDPNGPARSGHSPSQGGTVCVVTADHVGNVVSLLQSNFYGFGSGVVAADTGVALNCRACAFSLDPNRPDFLVASARPYHTLAPMLISRGNDVIGALGIIGASMQPQGHIQLLSRLIDQRLNPQAAIDAPRWEWDGGLRLAVENSTPPSIIDALQERGHYAFSTHSRTQFGRAQIVLRDPDSGVLFGGTDYRAEGHVAVW